MQIIVSTGFNNGSRPRYGKEFGINRPLSIKWMSKRHDIWLKYTLKSMLNQRYKDWIWAIKLHPNTKKYTDNVFSCCDDRIIETYGRDEEVAVLRKHKDVLLIRLDSDDMYHKNAIMHYKEAAESTKKEFFLCVKGYIYDINNGDLKRYDPPGSTPFHARRVNGKKHKWLSIGMQHRRIKFASPYIMPNDLYVVTVHGNNTSSRMELSTGDIDRDKNKILKGFGIG